MLNQSLASELKVKDLQLGVAEQSVEVGYARFLTHLQALQAEIEQLQNDFVALRTKEAEMTEESRQTDTFFLLKVIDFHKSLKTDILLLSHPTALHEAADRLQEAVGSVIPYNHIHVTYPSRRL